MRLQSSGEDVKEIERPIGTKRAKLRRRVSGDVSECVIDKVARCMKRMGNILTEKADAKREIEKRRTCLEEEYFWFLKA